ncbi:hypothetical protein ABKN59_010531 [Abortiporus biennis]
MTAALTRNINVALAVYDYCITLDQEVEKIWKRRFNLSSAIFVAVRYTTLCAVLGNSALNLFPPTHSASLSFLSLCNRIQVLIHTCRVVLVYGFRLQFRLQLQIYSLQLLIPLVLSGIIIDAVFNFAITYGGISSLQLPYGGCILVSNLPIDVQNRCAISFHYTLAATDTAIIPTLKLKRAADQAQLKGNLVSLLIRDGMVYLCLSFILDILAAILYNTDTKVAGIMVMVAPCNWFRHILLSRMILDLKSIDQISMASLQYMTSSQFSSIHFIGNIGAPLDILIEDEANISGAAIDATRSSVKQLLEDPLSIGLLDEQYKISEIILERGPLPSTVVPGTSEV